MQLGTQLPLPGGMDLGTSATEVAPDESAAVLSFEEAMLAELQAAPHSQTPEHVGEMNSPDLAGNSTIEERTPPVETQGIPLADPPVFTTPSSPAHEPRLAPTKTIQKDEVVTENLSFLQPSPLPEVAKGITLTTDKTSPTGGASETTKAVTTPAILTGNRAFPDTVSKENLRAPSQMMAPSATLNTKLPEDSTLNKPANASHQRVLPAPSTPAPTAQPTAQAMPSTPFTENRASQEELQSTRSTAHAPNVDQMRRAPDPVTATTSAAPEITSTGGNAASLDAKNSLRDHSVYIASAPEDRVHRDPKTEAPTTPPKQSYATIAGTVTVAPILPDARNVPTLSNAIGADVEAIIDASADLVATDMRGAETLTARTEVSGHLRTELPRHIALQLAEVAKSMPDRPVELTLRPEELGRLRMTFSGDITAMAVSVSVERPETLDLMRRHIDILAQEMRDIGYGEVSFSFEQSGSGQQENPGENSRSTPGRTQSGPDVSALADEPKTAQLELRAPSGVDIRL